MPRDHLRLLLQEHTRAERQDMTGQIMSRVYLIPGDNAGELMPTAHVAIQVPAGIVVLSYVPIAANNQELRHTTLGSPVRLKRSRTGRVEIVGLDKRGPGTVYNYTLNVSTASLTSGNVSGYSVSVLTYGQLASYGSGYGTVPFGAAVLFNAGSTFVAFV